jgi:hypothetical protein
VVQQNAVSVKEEESEVVIVPIDTTKPMVIDGKEYVNAVVKVRKKKKEVIDTTKTTVVKKEERKIEVKKKEKAKTVEKRSNWWWLLLIPFAVWWVRRYLLK